MFFFLLVLFEYFFSHEGLSYIESGGHLLFCLSSLLALKAAAGQFHTCTAWIISL